MNSWWGRRVSRSVEAARTEAEIVIFDVVGSVLEKVGLTGRDVDFLIINCRHVWLFVVLALAVVVARK